MALQNFFDNELGKASVKFIQAGLVGWTSPAIQSWGGPATHSMFDQAGYFCIPIRWGKSRGLTPIAPIRPPEPPGP